MSLRNQVRFHLTYPFMSYRLSVISQIYLTLSCGINLINALSTSHIRLCCGYWLRRAGPGRFTQQPSLTSGFKRGMTNYPHWVLLFVATGFAGRVRADLCYKLNPTSSWPLPCFSTCHVHVKFRPLFKSMFSCNPMSSFRVLFTFIIITCSM